MKKKIIIITSRLGAGRNLTDFPRFSPESSGGAEPAPRRCQGVKFRAAPPGTFENKLRIKEAPGGPRWFSRSWGQRGGAARSRVGAESRGLTAPARARRGRFVRGKPAGVTSKRATARPQNAPPGRNWMEPPTRPHSPPPRRLRRSRSPSFGAAQSFGVNEKSLRKGCGRASSPSTPSPPPHRLIFPRSHRFSPLPARSRPDPPSPGGSGRQKRAEEVGGKIPTGPPVCPSPKTPPGPILQREGNFSPGEKLKKNKLNIYIYIISRRMERERSRERRGKGLILELKLK